jgi:hypothetical protein
VGFVLQTKLARTLRVLNKNREKLLVIDTKWQARKGPRLPRSVLGEGNLPPALVGPRTPPGIRGDTKVRFESDFCMTLPRREPPPHATLRARGETIVKRYSIQYSTGTIVQGIPLFDRKYTTRKFLEGAYHAPNWPLLGKAREVSLLRSRLDARFARATSNFEDVLRDTLMDTWKRPNFYSKSMRKQIRNIIFNYNPEYPDGSRLVPSKVRGYLVNPNLMYWVQKFLRKSKLSIDGGLDFINPFLRDTRKYIPLQGRCF